MEQNLSELLQRSLTPARLELIQRAAEESAGLGLPIYLVGGLVRDLLLGRAPLDFDLVVEGSAPALGERLVNRFGGRLTIHTKFMTAKWFLPANLKAPALTTLDLISARSETYKHPGALPTVKPGNLTSDLRRRDFSINTLAIRLDGPAFGQLKDELGGLEDLKNKLVRVLHPRSFVDDPTRMYRAVRYEQRYGFQITPDTLNLINEARASIDKLSAQRIRHELDLILDEPNAAAMLERLAEVDLLRPVHLALPWDAAARKRLEASVQSGELPEKFENRTVNWLSWLMVLNPAKLESIDRRLRFEAGLMKSLMAASQLFADLPSLAGLKVSQCVERLEKLPLEAVYAVYKADVNQASYQALGRYLTDWRHIRPRTTAGDLNKRGLPPGPEYQSVLRQLRNAWLDGGIHSEAEELTLLDQLLLKERTS